MPEPLHAEAFRKFFAATPSHLEAVVAFGLFVDSEQKWAAESPRSTEDYRRYHAIYLTAHEIAGYIDAANRMLGEFGEGVVEQAAPTILTNAMTACNAALKTGHSKFRGWGICEATLGALLWTVILIGAALLARWVHPDALEIFKNIGGSSP